MKENSREKHQPLLNIAWVRFATTLEIDIWKYIISWAAVALALTWHWVLHSMLVHLLSIFFNIGVSAYNAWMWRLRKLCCWQIGGGVLSAPYIAGERIGAQNMLVLLKRNKWNFNNIELLLSAHLMKASTTHEVRQSHQTHQSLSRGK